jgi:hypothetical protein
MNGGKTFWPKVVKKAPQKNFFSIILRLLSVHSVAGLPDGLFLDQKSDFGQILESLAM